MKKQNSLYRMTTSEMQIMTYLWDSKEPAIASQIVSDLIPTQNCTWKPRSVFTILKSLSEKDLMADLVQWRGSLLLHPRCQRPAQRLSAVHLYKHFSGQCGSVHSR